MKRSLVVVSLVVVMVLGAMSAYAYGPGFGPRWKGGPCREGFEPGDGPALTPEQKTKLQELRQKFINETAKLRGEILTKGLELQALWTNPKAEAKTILDKEKELRDLQNQMKDKVLQSKLEARQFLTPEQMASFAPRYRMGYGMNPGFGRESAKGLGMGPGYGLCR